MTVIAAIVECKAGRIFAKFEALSRLDLEGCRSRKIGSHHKEAVGRHGRQPGDHEWVRLVSLGRVDSIAQDVQGLTAFSEW